MNKKNFFEAMGELDEKYYEETIGFKKGKKPSGINVLAAAAACLCVVIAAAILTPQVKKPAAKPTTTAEESSSRQSEQSTIQCTTQHTQESKAQNTEQSSAPRSRESTASEGPITSAVTSQTNHGSVSMSVAQTVGRNGETYFVCGEGEVEILKECSIPEKLDSSLAGKHISYLKYNESTSQYIQTESGSSELFEYAPQPNTNVYIVRIGGKYYAAVLHDENGYHGLPSLNR